MSKSLGAEKYNIGIDARLWNETGVGRYIRNLIQELQQIDEQNEYVLFVLSKDREQIASHITNSRFSLKTADIRWHTLQEQLKFPKILEKEKLDLVHFPYFSVPIFYKGPYVITIHDLILHHFPTGKASTRSWFVYQAKHLGYAYVMSQAAKNAAKILTVSHATEKEIVADLHVPDKKIMVTYEGVDNKIKNQEPKRKHLPKKYFLYVGNAYPHKNLERLVEAFGMIVRGTTSSLTELQLVLVGKEDFFYKRLKQIVKRLGLDDSIVFKHEVSDEELADLYHNAHALVMPSLMEGFGLPALEAMAQGCLVALSDIPVFHEIAGDAAVYFQPSRVQSMVNVLESIATGDVPHESEKKQKGKEIAKKFSWKKMAEQTKEIYQSCVGV